MKERRSRTCDVNDNMLRSVSCSTSRLVLKRRGIIVVAATAAVRISTFATSTPSPTSQRLSPSSSNNAAAAATKASPPPSPAPPPPPSSSSTSSLLWKVGTFAVVGATFFAGKSYFDDPSSWRYGSSSREEELTKDGAVQPQAEITSQVYFDVDIDNKPAGRIVIGLHGHVVPRTVKNFEMLCEGQQTLRKQTTISLPQRLAFEGSPFHRIIPGFM